MEQVILEYFCGDDEWTEEQREALPEVILNEGFEYPEQHYLMPVSEDELDLEHLLRVIDDWEQAVNTTVDWYMQGQSSRASIHLMKVLMPLNVMVKQNPSKFNATALISEQYSKLPRDARNDFIRKPTVLHLALLSVALIHHIDDETLAPLFEEKLNAVIKLGLAGGGRSPHDLKLWAIQILSVAGTFSLIKERFSKEDYLTWIYKLSEYCKKVKDINTEGMQPMSVGYVDLSQKALAAFGIENLTKKLAPIDRLKFYYKRIENFEKSMQRAELIELITQSYKQKVYDVAKTFVATNKKELLDLAEQERPAQQVFPSKRREVYLKPILAGSLTGFDEQLSSFLEKVPVGRFYDIKRRIDETITYLKQQDTIGIGCGLFQWENLFEDTPKHTKIYIRLVAMEDDCSLSIYLQLVVS